jgi:RNA recognition motif-containing protein
MAYFYHVVASRRNIAAQFSNKQEIVIPTRPLTDPSTATESPPSKVLHLRNLPEECSDIDIRTVSCPFGLVKQVLFLSRKQQAFVEFSTVEEAAAMLVSSKALPIRIGTRSDPAPPSLPTH